MALKEEFERSGNWLFTFRSYLPLFIIGLLLVALLEFRYPFGSHKLDQLIELFCLFISFFGLTIRIFTIGYVPKGTSGRNTKRQVADVLNTTGIYSIVRHPLYLGNFFIIIGISLMIRVWWYVIMVMLIFWIYYERIMFAEEEFLRNKFGEEFLEWARKTPAFLPKFRNWKPQILPFSVRKILKSEYASFFGIIVSFTCIEIIGDIFVLGKFYFDSMWLVIFTTSSVIYLILRILAKKTRILDVEGR